MAILEVKTIISGFTGGPGYNQLYFKGLTADDAAATAAATITKGFWSGVASRMPNACSIAVQRDVRLLNEATGTLVDFLDGSTLAPTVGTGGAEYAGGTGACISLLTATVGVTRRIRGRIFVLPLAAAQYENNGTLNSATVSTLDASAAGLIADPGSELVVWHRPVDGTGGVIGTVLGAHVADQAARLDSRRF